MYFYGFCFRGSKSCFSQYKGEVKMTYIENIKEFISGGYKVHDCTCNREMHQMWRMLRKCTPHNTGRCR